MKVREINHMSDLLSFVKENRSRIESGHYDIKLEPWFANSIDKIPEDVACLLAKYCESSIPVLMFDKRVSVLTILIDIVTPFVRELIAGHNSTPPEILKRLSTDESEKVRVAVARNKNTPPETVAALLKDDNEDVRKAASKKGCFIATSVYGSEIASEVILLREFRDRILLRHLLGKWFVATYYAVSPPLAVLIKRTCVLKSVVKWCILSPLLRVIKNKFPSD